MLEWWWGQGGCGGLGRRREIWFWDLGRDARGHRRDACATCWNCRDGVAGLAEKTDGALDGNVAARRDDDFQQGAFLEAFHVHDRFVGLDGEEDVAFGDFIAFLLAPFHDGALFGHLTELGHDDGGSHT